MTAVYRCYVQHTSSTNGTVTKHSFLVQADSVVEAAQCAATIAQETNHELVRVQLTTTKVVAEDEAVTPDEVVAEVSAVA